MAVFAESGMYLEFGESPWGKKRALLWPVFVYQVLYPDPRRAQLNLLQRAVLGLVRARAVHTDEIAALTGLHIDLIKLILAQGVSNGWLNDSADALTSKGEALLNDEDISDADMKSGYLLQDVLSGQFWPRLFGQLSEIEPSDPSARYPEFKLNRKTGKSIRPFILPVMSAELPELAHDSLMSAYQDYREDYRAAQQLGLSSGLPEQVRLQGIQRLGDSAQSARVLVWVTADAQGLDLWSVKDPFSLREHAWWLQEPLRQVVEQNTSLLSYVSGLVSIPQAENQSVEEWLEAIHMQTELQVLVEYPWVERQPDIKRHLAALLVRMEKLKQGDSSFYELDAALIESQKLLEVVMQWLIRTYPADIGQLPRQQVADFSLKQKILSALEVPALTDAVINELARQNLRQVIRACSRPISSLKALLFAAAVGTLNEPSHPLKILGSSELQLDKLMDLADLRNQSSHAQSSFTGKKQTQLTTRTALESIQYSLNFTAYFKEWM